MSISNKIETVESVLKIDPVSQRSDEISKMYLAAGLHTAQYALFIHLNSSVISDCVYRRLKRPMTNDITG